jgi:TRAP-type uncharacterized transport system substrate-binding protein
LDDLATLRGVDAAIVQADALSSIGAADRGRLRFISAFEERELHVLAGRSVTDLRELEGRKVNIGSPGSGTQLTGRIVFEKLGVKPEFTSYDHATALKKLHAGEIDSVVYLRARPASLLTDFEPQERFHLVPVPIAGELVKSYHPVRLEARHYPNLIKEKEGVETLAVSNVLAVLDCPRASARCERLSRFVNELFSHQDAFRRHGQDSPWEEISPLLDLQGWRRFRPAQFERRSKQAGLIRKHRSGKPS